MSFPHDKADKDGVLVHLSKDMDVFSSDKVHIDEVLVPFPFGMIHKDTELLHMSKDRIDTDEVAVPLSDDMVCIDTALMPLSDDIDTFSPDKADKDEVLVPFPFGLIHKDRDYVRISLNSTDKDVRFEPWSDELWAVLCQKL